MRDSLFLEFDASLASDITSFFSKHSAKPEVVHYRKGEVISRTDLPQQSIFCSKSGYVVSYSLTPNGQRDIHTFTRPQTIFPVTEPFTPKLADHYLPKRTRFFEALSDVTVWRRPMKDFNQFVDVTPRAKTALLRYISLNHRIASTRIEMMQLRDITPRLVCFLLVLALLIGERDGIKAHIEAPISHQLIADSLSIARETASREMFRLKQQSLIEYAEHHITLLSIPKLRAMVEDY